MNPPTITWSPVITEPRVEPEPESFESLRTVLKLELDPPELPPPPPPPPLLGTVVQAVLDGSELPAELNARTV
jgi:hypothetical protein